MTATRRATLVWALLLALTFSSVVIEESPLAKLATATLVLGIAAVKVHFIGMYFMDLRDAPRQLRQTFAGFVGGIFAVLVVIMCLGEFAII